MRAVPARGIPCENAMTYERS
ncbi:hypothetical protein BN11_1080014 [Nostocoides australiense Ben110]|uniref:Uncharacterized protein n=1 Tax=Nostocoides australiense Ben110 TaxID=1193182 RepID=W6K089_9MICO|nr:hypothetical protein BN11_1080014 [Tetrasphaera australiensis Ben110]